MAEYIKPLDIEVALPAEAPLGGSRLELSRWIETQLRTVVSDKHIWVDVIGGGETASWRKLRIGGCTEDTAERIGNVLRKVDIKYPIVDDLAETDNWDGGTSGPGN